MTPPGRARRRALPWVGAWLAATLALWALDMASGPNLTDGAWFQQVADRVLQGDSLYGDVFYGVLPLSVWVSMPAVLVFGAEAAVVKAVCAAIAAGTAVLAVLAARLLGVGRWGLALVGAGSVAYLTLPSVTPYTPLSYLLLLAVLCASLEWESRAAGAGGPDGVGARRALLWGGFAAGLSVGSKHSVGLAALAALGAVAVLLGPRERLDWRGRGRDLGVLLAAAAAVVVAIAIPVALSGSLGEMWAFVFQKGEYLRSAQISYLDGLDRLVDAIGDPLDQPRELFTDVLFVLPPLGLIALALAARRQPERAATLALFLAAALAAAVPRASSYHVGFVAPVAAVALVWAGGVLLAGRRPAAIAAGAAAAILLALTFGYALFDGALDSLRRGDDASDQRGLHGVLVPDGTDASVQALGDGLATADAESGPTLVLMPSAGLAYLRSGVTDPTPFDYPLKTAIRGEGRDLSAEEDELIGRIEAGEIAQVCLGDYYQGFGELAPERLIAYVRERMRPAGRAGTDPILGCELFRPSAG